LNRINVLRQTAAKQGKSPNFVIFNQANLTYFANFSGATALYIPKQGESILYVSGVNYEQAKAEAKDVTVELLKGEENLMDKIAKLSPDKKLAVDTMPVESWHALVKAVGGEEKLEPSGNLIRELRKIKDQQEIQLIRKACKLSNIGIQTASKTICPGVTEKLVAAEAEYVMRKAGADGTAFDTIVASGFCCAYPHGTFLERTIQEGDFVVVDLGAKYRLYCSDITRTYVAGKTIEKQSRIYKTVKLAQQKAIESIKPGIPAKEVDRLSRQVIEEAGFCDFFVHNLGHGVGLEVHEAPILSPNSKDILEAGNVITVEPGIYLPGFGGVRIEDTILITREGAEKLTDVPYLL
jgi:Xaa-Pro dipeptidase